jgi:hypothetical protein
LSIIIVVLLVVLVVNPCSHCHLLTILASHGLWLWGWHAGGCGGLVVIIVVTLWQWWWWNSMVGAMVPFPVLVKYKT